MLACGLTLALATSAVAQCKEAVATVFRVSGSVQYSPACNGVFQPLHKGDVVIAGALIQTGLNSKSSVDLIIGEQGTIKIGPSIGTTPYHSRSDQNTIHIHSNSVLGIDKLTITDPEAGGTPVIDTELDLRLGHITGNVKKMTAGSHYEIKYKSGVAGIRGSVYDMLVEDLPDGTAKCTLRMIEGAAVLSYINAAGEVSIQEIFPGQQFSPGPGATPGQIPPEVLNTIQPTLTGMSVPPVSVPRLLAPPLTTIEYVSATK
jgi:hypothetical protein